MVLQQAKNSFSNEGSRLIADFRALQGGGEFPNALVGGHSTFQVVISPEVVSSSRYLKDALGAGDIENQIHH